MKKLLAVAGFTALISFISPLAVFADEPTGDEPFSNGFIEAELWEGITTYSLKNLTNKQWQSNLIIDWKANIPCGTFDQSQNGLTAQWNRSVGCESIDLKASPVYVAIFIENLGISGKERVYTDGYVVEFPGGPENIIVYAEYPEEGRKHGFGTSLLYADESAISKYYGAKSASLGLDAFELKPEAEEATKDIPNDSQSERASSDGNIAWIPITLGVVALVGAGFVFKKRFSDKWSFGANASMNDWNKKEGTNVDFSRDSVPDDYANEDELKRRDREDAIEASDKVDRENRNKSFKKVIQEEEDTKRAEARPRYSDTAPADYKAPEGALEDPEAM